MLMKLTQKINYNIYKLISTWHLYAKHAESDSSQVTDATVTNPSLRDKATNILSTKEIFKTQQSSVDGTGIIESTLWLIKR